MLRDFAEYFDLNETDDLIKAFGEERYKDIQKWTENLQCLNNQIPGAGIEEGGKILMESVVNGVPFATASEQAKPLILNALEEYLKNEQQAWNNLHK